MYIYRSSLTFGFCILKGFTASEAESQAEKFSHIEPVLKYAEPFSPFTRISLRQNFQEAFISQQTSRPPYQKSRVSRYTVLVPSLPFSIRNQTPADDLFCLFVCLFACLLVTLPFQDFHPPYNTCYLILTKHLLLPNTQELCHDYLLARLFVNERLETMGLWLF